MDKYAVLSEKSGRWTGNRNFLKGLMEARTVEPLRNPKMRKLLIFFLFKTYLSILV